MFVRKLKNRSGSTSVQVIQKIEGKYQVHKSIGSATAQQDIEKLVMLGKQEIDMVPPQPKLFSSESDLAVEQALSTISNTDIRTVGPEIVFGKIYDGIGFGQIDQELFRHLVIARLAFPLSKLKTAEYLYRYQGKGRYRFNLSFSGQAER